MRIDKYLFESGFVDSRNKASELVKSSKVLVNNVVVKKTSFDVNETHEVEIIGEVYVSRAAWKLKYFLEELSLVIKGKTCLDIGSSTGGFTQVLLENGALSVVCVDVGKEQLHETLKSKNEVTVYEEMDIRDFNSSKLFDIVVCDVSFISLDKIIDKIKELSKEDVILLFKPQFEVGKNAKRTKKGVLKNQKDVEKAFVEFETKLQNCGFRIVFTKSSKLSGKEGNVEQFYYINKS